MKAYDVIIVGAGSVGLPTALFLGEAGLRVLVMPRTEDVKAELADLNLCGIRMGRSNPTDGTLVLPLSR